jgi:hypothetical protein
VSVTVSVIDGRYAPQVICDTCGQAITRPAMAAVVYNMEGKGDRTCLFVHKGPCHDAADERIRAAGGFPGWDELGTWVANLLHNTGFDDDELARAQDTASLFWEMGI